MSVELLREFASYEYAGRYYEVAGDYSLKDVCLSAADEIERLRQENNRLHTECGHREADVVELRQELSEVRESVRTLLRDARRWSDSEWYLIVGAEAYEAARAVGGGE